MPSQTISNPLRILALGAPSSGILDLLRSLTGAAPTPVDDSTAGLSHTWDLTTQYYKAELSIWIDEITSISAWKSDFLGAEAKEVVRALGAVVFCFKKPVTQDELDTIKETMSGVKEVIDTHWKYSWDGVRLAVSMPSGIVATVNKSEEEWDDLCREEGFEYVDAAAKGRNEFGELQGISRVREALEANEWEAVPDDFDTEGQSVGLEDGEEAFEESFAAEEAEINLELLGVKTAFSRGNDNEEEGVEEFERMVRKLQAIKGTSCVCAVYILLSRITRLTPCYQIPDPPWSQKNANALRPELSTTS